MKTSRPSNRRILLDSGYKGRQRPKLEMYDLRRKTDITVTESEWPTPTTITLVIGTAVACGWLGSPAIAAILSLVGLGG